MINSTRKETLFFLQILEIFSSGGSSINFFLHCHIITNHVHRSLSMKDVEQLVNDSQGMAPIPLKKDNQENMADRMAHTKEEDGDVTSDKGRRQISGELNTFWTQTKG
ncbi:unnamed protein product [Coffea canephora]|uniref:Uncharacterized protein n=1 Tax=Coffea canephora TaxID=49390 RepID=A0A068UXC4_COFCA|nr:unnamed protein product [Coffea canephora]